MSQTGETRGPFDWMEEAGKREQEHAQEYSEYLRDREARIDEAYRRSIEETGTE